MKKLFIIDANSLIHRAYHALPPFTAPDGRPAGAIYGISNILMKVIKEKKPDYIVAAFDRPEPTFRDEAYAEYKGTRAKTADELVSQIIEARKTFDIFKIKYFEIPGFEADDILMTIAKSFEKEKDLQIVLFSGDLDLLQAVTNDKIVLETPKKGIGDSVVYSEEGVFGRLGVSPKQVPDYKGLVGDTSDNIPGVVGIGPKTAADLLKQYGTIENMYKEIDEMGMSNLKLLKKLRDGKNFAFLSKKLATLRTDAPITLELEDAALKPFDRAKLTEYFLSFGFESLVQRLG